MFNDDMTDKGIKSIKFENSNKENISLTHTATRSQIIVKLYKQR